MKRMMRGLSVLCAALLVLGGAFAEEGEIDMLLVDRKLYELGYRDGACNGELDEVTINALKSFQLANDLKITGEPDDETLNLLMSGNGKTEREYLSALAYKYNEATSLAKGSYGEGVTKLQRALKKLGYFRSESDGAYGDATAAAVYRFQLANGLKESGVADGSTQMRLFEGTPIQWEDFLSNSQAVAGDTGEHVRRLQIRLKDMGYFVGKCSGRYGEATRQAVMDFQDMNERETTGDADKATCERIYSNSAVALTDAQALYRGSTGAAVEAFCRRLQEMNYPADDSFTIRTEIALLQFQLVNQLEPTGALDGKTSEKLNSAAAVAYDVNRWRSYVVEADAQDGARLVKTALSKLGYAQGMESSFEFVQYIHLKCGQALMDEAQLKMVRLSSIEAVTAGDTLLFSQNGRSFYGIATADGVVVYRSETDYVVMSYLKMLNSQELYIWQKGSGDGD